MLRPGLFAVIALSATAVGAAPSLVQIAPSPAAAVVDEGFDNLSTLAEAGWLQINRSEPRGFPHWNAGSAASFAAFDGAPNAYISADMYSGAAPSPTTISQWLISPPIAFAPDTRASFYTRSIRDIYQDRLQVRLCTGAACTNVGTGATDVGDFTTLLLDINAGYTGAYPTTWTQQTLDALPSQGTGRLAFRYFVEDGGPNGARSSMIGIDRVVVSRATGGSLPPTLSMAFAPAQVAIDTPSRLRLTLRNRNAAAATLTAALANAFPAGLVTAAAPNAATTCTGGAGVTVTAGSVALAAGAIVPAAGSCTVDVDVVASIAGRYTNTVAPGGLQTDLGSSPAEASATLRATGGTRPNGVYRSPLLNQPIRAQFVNGTSVNWVTGAFDTNGPFAGDWDMNLDPDSVDVLAVNPLAAYAGAVVVNASAPAPLKPFALLQPGDVVGPASAFATDYGHRSDGFLPAGTVGYVGFRFRCDGRLTNPVPAGACYGYFKLAVVPLAGPTGAQVEHVIVDYAYDGDGRPVTVLGACVTPDTPFCDGFEGTPPTDG